jgi:chemotaxis protein methyltransferase CheR
MTSAPSAVRKPEGLPDGEFAFSDANFQVIARIAKSDAGIDLPPSKATLVYSRLAKRLRTLGIQDFSKYCDFVREDETERNHMIASLTTNVTRFFREPHHFEHLKREIITPLAETARRGGRVRLWSAACSTGQEPYSMALTLLSVIPEAASLDIRILATDLNPNVVARGNSGRYEKQELTDIPPAMLAKWFKSENGSRQGSMIVSNEVRGLVSFRQLNLMGDWPFKGPFDAVFCRNVVIYFDRETQSTIWKRLTGVLRDRGALYIGHSERVSGPATSQLAVDGITTYRKGGATP